jgi:hypothetical protein
MPLRREEYYPVSPRVTQRGIEELIQVLLLAGSLIVVGILVLSNVRVTDGKVVEVEATGAAGKFWRPQHNAWYVQTCTQAHTHRVDPLVCLCRRIRSRADLQTVNLCSAWSPFERVFRPETIIATQLHPRAEPGQLHVWG